MVHGWKSGNHISAAPLVRNLEWLSIADSKMEYPPVPVILSQILQSLQASTAPGVMLLK